MGAGIIFEPRKTGALLARVSSERRTNTARTRISRAAGLKLARCRAKRRTSATASIVARGARDAPHRRAVAEERILRP